MKHRFRFAVMAALLCTMPHSFGQSNDSVTIDMSEEYQHISGFGGANIPDWDVDLNADQAAKYEK
jgi:O-glycosyl hydrolase